MRSRKFVCTSAIAHITYCSYGINSHINFILEKELKMLLLKTKDKRMTEKTKKDPRQKGDKNKEG